MFAAILSALLPALADSVVKALFDLLTNEMQKRNLVAQGMAIQAAAETATSEKVEGDIAGAESENVDAGTVEGRLKDGSF